MRLPYASRTVLSVFMGSLAVAVLLAVRPLTRPHIEKGVFRTGDASRPFSTIVDENGVTGGASIDFDLRLSSLAPRGVYTLHTYVCIRDFVINGVPVQHGQLCNYQGTRIDLAPYLRIGTNHLSLQTVDMPPKQEFRFALMPPALHGPTRFIDLLIALVIGYTLCTLFSSAGKIRWLPMATVAMGAVLLRVWYLESTLYFVRAWDWSSHLWYVKYILEHSRLPPSSAGVEFFQPPLYYLLGALWATLTGMAYASQELLATALRSFSLLLALYGVALAAWIAQLLFPGPHEERDRVHLLAIVAVFPGLLFFTSRVSNEVLLMPLTLLSFALLLTWWRSRAPWAWHTNAFVLAAGWLTKATMVPLIWLMMACALLQKGSWKQRLGWFVTGTLPSACAFMLFGALRHALDGGYAVINRATLATLETDNALSKLLTFNPWKVLEIPFNANWAMAFRPQFFWEYFFKSGFVGEWSYQPATIWPLRILLAMTMVALLVAVIGWINDIRTRPHAVLPVWLAAVMLIGAVLVNRLWYHYITGQDFRYIPLIVFPVAFFALRGLDVLQRTWKIPLTWLAVAYCGVCFSYVLLMLEFGMKNIYAV